MAAKLEIRRPSGLVSEEVVAAGERKTMVELVAASVADGAVDEREDRAADIL